MPVAAPTTGLLMLFRADSLSALADGAAVPNWVDSVGGRSTAARSAAPTKLASGAGSQPAVRFNGTSQSLIVSNPPTIPQPHSTVIVARSSVTTSAARRTLIWQGSGGEVGATLDGKWFNNGGADRIAQTPLVTTNPTVLTSVFEADTGNSATYVNGTLAVTANTGNGPMNQGILLIGENFYGPQLWAGDIYEIRVYDHVLTAAERSQIHSYSQDRYGITVSDYSAGAGDTIAPTVPTNVTATANSGTQVTVAWTSSTDAVGVSTYRVQRNGTTLTAGAAVTSSPFVDTTAVAGTTYSYTVSAVDAAGNRSAESSSASATTPAPTDTTAPTVPSGVTATANSAAQVSVNWSGSTDAVGVSTYRVRRGGADLPGATALSSGTRTFVDTTVAASTNYSYTVSAVDAAGNRSAESTAATVTTPAASSTVFQTRVGNAWVERVTRARLGNAWVSVLHRVVASAGAVIDPVTGGISTPARWQINFGGTPLSRVTSTTSVVGGLAQVTWVGSFPDVRARTSRLETGVAAQPQDGYQAQIMDLTNSTIVADSGAVTGTAEKWVATGFSPVAGRRYQGRARVRSTDGKWSEYAATRFVAPTGVIRYLEDFGAVGDGTTLSGTRYSVQNYVGPIRNAGKACNPGDIIRSKNPGTTIGGVTASGNTLSSATAVFTQAMSGKKVIVYQAGTTDTSTNSWNHKTTVTSVATDLKSVTLASPVSTNGIGLTIVVNYAEYLTNHIDFDNGMGGPGNGGGWTLDGTGCIFTSDEFANNNSTGVAGFRTTIPDLTFLNVHYWQKNATTRGTGKAGNTGPFFVDGDPVNNPIGTRIIGCYAERAIDAGILIYGPKAVDIHVVDSVADHTNADGFHVTGAANNVQFIRTTNAWIGDDAVANIGYRSDGDGSRPYNVVWETPRVLGQDWGRGVSFGGCRDCLVTDLYIERGAGASFILGSDGDMANTSNIQIRRGQIVAPNLRRGQKPTYSQGAGTSSTIPDEPWMKIINSSSATAQGPILMEDITVQDGRYFQIISYGGGTFVDNAITLRGIKMIGTTNGGTNWRDEGTYPNHIDLRGISVPSGSTPITAAPSSPNTPG